MPQVLKEEIYERIFQAGIDVFYEKDYRSAKMQDIADKAQIPVGLIYTYFKHKEQLFTEIVSSVLLEVSKDLGEAMVGINEDEIKVIMSSR